MVGRSFALMAATAAAGLALTGVAVAAAPLAAHPGQEITLAGTRIYCAVEPNPSGVILSCAIVRTGTLTPEGYTVGISDRVAGVTHFVGKSAPPVVVHAQPALRLPSPGAAGKGSGTITLRLGQSVPIAGTHVVLAAGRDPQHEPALAAAIVGADGNPLDGSYSVGISEHQVVLLSWRHAKASLAFRVQQPSR